MTFCNRSYILPTAISSPYVDDASVMARAKADEILNAFKSIFEVASFDSVDTNRIGALELGRTLEIVNTKTRFKISLDVRDLTSSELSVKCIRSRLLAVHGKRSRQNDECQSQNEDQGEGKSGGCEFLKSYLIPKGVDVSKLKLTLLDVGVMTIEAPKRKSAVVQKLSLAD